MTLKLDDLTERQRSALIDICVRRGLHHVPGLRGGYGEGERVHARAVVNSLQKIGLCVIRDISGRRADPTEAGWSVVKRALKGSVQALGTLPAHLR